MPWLQKKTKKSTYVAAKEGIGYQGCFQKERFFFYEFRQALSEELLARLTVLTKFKPDCPVLLPLLMWSPRQPSSDFLEFCISSRKRNDNAKCYDNHIKIIKGTRVPPSGLGKYYLWWQKRPQKNSQVQMEVDLLNYRQTQTSIACLWSVLKGLL